MIPTLGASVCGNYIDGCNQDKENLLFPFYKVVMRDTWTLLFCVFMEQHIITVFNALKELL